MTETDSRSAWNKVRWAIMLLFAVLLFAACADDDEEPPAGLSESDVAAIVEADIEAAIAELPEPDPGLTAAEVEEIVKGAIAEIPASEPGLSAARVEQIARSVAIARPPRADAAEYTKFFVDTAIARYEAEGPEATFEYYNSLDSIDGDWYMFIIDADERVVAHFDRERIGRDARDPIYSDINGYYFAPELLSATEEGKWVGYAYQNPGTGDISTGDFGDYELKNSWVVRHDGFVFGSGWYINADEMTQAFVQAAADAYVNAGIEGVFEALSHPDAVFSGAAGALEYYNTVDHIDGEFFAFTAGPDGTIWLHTDPSKVGTHIDEVFGGAEFSFSVGGNWVETEGTDAETGNTVTTRLWGVDRDGTEIASGWRNDGTQ